MCISICVSLGISVQKFNMKSVRVYLAFKHGIARPLPDVNRTRERTIFGSDFRIVRDNTQNKPGAIFRSNSADERLVG